MIKGSRKAQGGFDLSEAPSHLIRRCQQFYGDLYAREAGARELTKQQFILLAALEQNDGASQTALVEITGIDRSTLAEMVRRMLEKALLTRERTEEDQRANTVAISPSGRKALRNAKKATSSSAFAIPPPPVGALRVSCPDGGRAARAKYTVLPKRAHAPGVKA